MATHPGQAAPYVFLSYASVDRERALGIADLLEANGAAVWIDRKGIAGGSSWSAEIVEGIKGCTVLAVLISRASVVSRNVQQEVQLAWENDRKVLPLVLEKAQLPSSIEYALAGRQWIEVLDHADDRWLPVALRALANLGLTSRSSGIATASPEPEQPPSESSSPPSRTETVPPRRHNLPIPVTSFVGRERELAEVKGLLADTHLLTLTGTGGCGKTRLALQAAAGLVDRFPDGVWFVDLAPLNDPALVLQAAALALGIREIPGHAIRTTLLESLRSRLLLLLLDNCEHLIEACAQLADAVLQTCGEVRILATSRETLGVRGETSWRVPSLAQLDLGSGTSLEELRQNEAIRLFVDRAQAVVPGFDVTRENASPLAQVCQRLDGIPLAIELAAARVRVLTVDQIAARLDDRFRLLTGGSRTALRRQQTLRALIDWSHDLLSEAERMLFRRLAVFSGGWILEAAEVVCSGTGIEGYEVLDLLTGLVDKSLVQFEGQGEDKRYRFLETVRAYAGELLFEVGEARLIRDQHRDWYLALAERALPGMEGHEQKLWADRLEDEHDNLRAALVWSAADPADSLSLLHLSALLGRFWRNRGYNREAIQWLDTAVGRSVSIPSSDRARALNWLGHFEWIEGNVERSRPLLEESVALARTVGDRKVLAHSLRHLSHTAYSVGDWAEARRLLDEAVAVGRAAGYKREIAYALLSLASLRVHEDAPGAIEPLVVESLAIARESGDPIPICEALFGLSWVNAKRGEFSRARVTVEECLALARRADVKWPIMFALVWLGDLAAAEQNLEEAIDRYRQALQMTIDAHRGVAAYTLGRYAAVSAASGDHRRAACLLGAASTAPGFEDAFFLFAGSPQAAEDQVAARLALGEKEFAMAWAEGQAMTLEQAIAYALEEDSVP